MLGRNDARGAASSLAVCCRAATRGFGPLLPDRTLFAHRTLRIRNAAFNFFACHQRRAFFRAGRSTAFAFASVSSIQTGAWSLVFSHARANLSTPLDAR